jgi:CRP-like cAMP-binding protein
LEKIMLMGKLSWAQGNQHELAAGDLLFEAGAVGVVWRLQSGALRLDNADGQFMQLVLPGDMMGVELLAASAYAYTARAIVPSTVAYSPLGNDAERRMALLDGLMQQQRRMAHLVALRSGTTQDRLKQLLLLLAPDESAWDEAAARCVLPTLKDMAAILDTAPETVSRIFANLKRSHLLDVRQRQSASFNVSRLRDAAWPTGMTRSDGGRRMAEVLQAA